MGHFLDVAYKILAEEKKPMTAREITSIALEKNILHTRGKTPWMTMKSKLSTDILNRRERSNFKRTGKALFALRVWDESEYVAKKFKKSLLKEDVVVFPKSSLHKYVKGVGLHVAPLENSKNLIDECFSMERQEAEKDFNVIQLVSAFLIKYNDEYLIYKRTKRLPEERLHGYYSIIFGGHLNPDDISPLFDVFRPENKYLLERELREELKFPYGAIDDFKYKGLIYDDSRDLSKQHIGIAYDVIVNTKEYEIGERGFLINSRFESLEKIETHIHEFENWSVSVINFEKGLNNCT